MSRSLHIFYASDTAPTPGISQVWRNNLLLPLRDLGHDVEEFDFDLRETFLHLDTTRPADSDFIAHNRPRVSAELLRQVKAAHAVRPLDVFFSYFYDACILPEVIDAIREMGITTVNWYCNGSYQLHLVQDISPHYDWCLVPERFRLTDYAAMGACPLYCQEAANPVFYHPVDVPQEYDVVFVGQAYGERPDYIRWLLNAGIDVRVWGMGWLNHAPVSLARQVWRWARRLLRHGPPPVTSLPTAILGGLLPDEEMVAMYSRTKINLGFSAVGETHRTGERIVQVRLRDFEIPMSGGFYLVEYMEELEEFYDIGREIACYTGPNDLVEKTRYYLAHDQERLAIAHAGRERCLRDHTWQKRLMDSFAAMGLVA